MNSGLDYLALIAAICAVGIVVLLSLKLFMFAVLYYRDGEIIVGTMIGLFATLFFSIMLAVGINFWTR